MVWLPLIGAVGAADIQDVPRYQPVDLTFHGPAQLANPFAVVFEAHVDGPSDRDFVLPGFYDGDGRWVVRLAPTEAGRWHIRTSSTLPELNDREATLVCAHAGRGHGGIRIDPLSPHHFVYEDGTRRFCLAYECDWLWALDLGRTDGELPTLLPFLDTLAEHRFTEVLLNAYAHDTAWRPGRTGPDDYGPPPLFPWEGSNERPDHSRFNLAYWQHFDRVIAALADRGIAAHLMIKVYNKMVNWPARRSPEEALYFRWLVARYAAFPNLIWDFSKESYNEKDLAYKLDCLRTIRRLDPYRRLLTTHDDDGPYDAGAYDDLLDFQTDQNHSRFHERVLAQRQRRAWPILNAELGYEHGPAGLEDYTYPVAQHSEEVARRAWEVYLAGGYAAYYYTYTAWDVIRTTDRPRGLEDFRHIAEFFDRVGYERMVPADELVDRGYCLANPGVEYVAWVPDGEPFTIRTHGEHSGEWFRCLTGEWQPLEAPVENGGNKLWPPREWRGGPVALHLGTRPDR